MAIVMWMIVTSVLEQVDADKKGPYNPSSESLIEWQFINELPLATFSNWLINL